MDVSHNQHRDTSTNGQVDIGAGGPLSRQTQSGLCSGQAADGEKNKRAQSLLKNKWVQAGLSNARPKDKGAAQIPPVLAKFKKPSPIKTRQARAIEQAQKAALEVDGQGLIKVNVEYGHLSNLGEGWGVSNDQVVRALQEDNSHRALNHPSPSDQMYFEAEQEGPHLDFDLSQDEFSEDEEAGGPDL